MLEDEIARARDGGRRVRLWWRDDDACEATPALERLLALGRRLGLPLALAVVPAGATAALGRRLAVENAVDVLQHGYAHVNHATPSEKKIELGPHRPAMLVLGELGTGWLALERLFGSGAASRLLPVLVPPWNRIAPGLLPPLPEIGFTGLSTFGIARRERPVPGLRQVNTHLDLIDWKGSRAFAGEPAALAGLVGALQQCSDAGQPVGILSHHLAMDEAAWDFLEKLWDRARGMPGIDICTARELFAQGEARD